MTTRTYPATAIPELTDSQIKDIVANLDMSLNNTILGALLYGIYTGVVAITLWAVAFNLYLRYGTVGLSGYHAHSQQRHSGRIHVYQRVIEILVESALFYSLVMVILLVFEAHNEMAANYIKSLAIAMRNDTQMSVGSVQDTSSTKRPSLEEGLEDIKFGG
ncbi:hypothetical protein IW261DRAFT_1426872 [Armillaria novae-zelandiae]|uniref:Uncharacterized protein n=1 Tax=Armillaria novae-zelandiae TaxID=153914 RepID=A0AA39TU73_9AGAR|nr:hypothetical protein IW261DRAFT_1426872 [Armillaria novae-zelandiae]